VHFEAFYAKVVTGDTFRQWGGGGEIWHEGVLRSTAACNTGAEVEVVTQIQKILHNLGI